MCPRRNGRVGSVALRGRCCEVGGVWIAQPAGVHRRCVGEQKCSGRACRCAGANEGLRRGRCCEVGGECIAQPAGVRRGCVGERKCSARACRCAGASEGLRRGNASRSLRACVGAAWGNGSTRGGRVAVRGRAEVFGGEWVVRSAGNASRSLRACGGAAWASGSAREGRVAVRGWAKVFGGEWVVRSAGLTHIRRSSTRARVLLYIRPPCPRREIAAMGPKDAPCEHPSPAKTSAFAASAFIFPPRRSHFPPRIPFSGAHEDFDLPQQQLSTMGYPRKSYPHRCPSPCAKRSRPRACARVYII